MLRYRIKQWREERQQIKTLKRGIKRLDKKYAPLFKGAAEENEFLIVDNYVDEVSAYQPRLEYLKTRKLLQKAHRLGIEVNPRQDGWFTKQYNVYSEVSYVVLSELGEIKLRNLIRNHRRENIEWWLKVVAALTGLIGTIIGLVAILK